MYRIRYVGDGHVKSVISFYLSYLPSIIFKIYLVHYATTDGSLDGVKVIALSNFCPL